MPCAQSFRTCNSRKVFVSLLLAAAYTHTPCAADPPDAELPEWRTSCYNCYNYALDNRSAFFANPTPLPPDFTIEDVRDGAIDDGLIQLAWNEGDPPPEPPAGMCLVAMAYAPATAVDPEDYHWYRRNDDGTWSHKRGQAFPHLFHDLGDDPATSSRGIYEDFGGYFAVPGGPDTPVLSSFAEPWDGLVNPRVFDLRFAGLENPHADVPHPQPMPHVPTGQPLVPPPNWPDFGLVPARQYGYALLLPTGHPAPHRYYHVYNGVVAAYSNLEGTTVTFYADNNGLENYLRSRFSPTIPTVSEWGLVVMGVGVVVWGVIAAGRRVG